MKDRKNQIDNLRRETFQSVDEVEMRIRQMEVKHNLLQYKLENWCVWPILRLKVGYLMEDLPLIKKDRISRIKQFFFAIRDVPRLLFLRRVRYVVETSTSSLVEQEGRFYKDIWFDDFLSEVGDYFKIERINSPALVSRRKAALFKSNLSTTLFDLIAYVLARVGGPRYISEIAEHLGVCLRSELGAIIFTTTWVKVRLLHFYWYKKCYAWLLKRIRPKYLLMASPSEYAVVAAAKEQGIKVIELLHGYVHRYHHGYSWQANAAEYRYWMPIPDRLFLYGEHGKQELEVNGFWGEALRVVGSLRMDEYRQRKIAKKRDGACTLVVTTQGIDVEKIIAFISHFLEAAKQRLDLHLYFKMHPAYETEKILYEAAFRDDPRVQVLLGNEDPSTYELLTRAHIHLSISSTCHYEALGLGVPIVILPFPTHEIVLSLHTAGHAFLVKTPRDLLEIALKWRELQVPDDVGEYYFKAGALENMKRELG